MRAKSIFIWLSALLLTAPTLAGAQELPGEEGHGGGGAGCGDVFGDLIEVKRDIATGQPILAKRWIESPGDVYDWGYCPIAVTSEGEEIDFVELTCDPVDPEAVVEVDYFGRLNGGRTKERNNRMHFNEVIGSIKDAGWVTTDETGRLMLGYVCTIGEGAPPICETWSTVDSPMENMGLYTRLMKYGHFQTDPVEVDKWAHGDPATLPQYHPALGPEDQAKFDEDLAHLLFRDGDGGATACFPGYPTDPETFTPGCAGRENLAGRDFESAANFLSAAANKTGRITADLVQYINRILKIALDTEATMATRNTLPTLIRVCETLEPPVPGVEPIYLDECAIEEGSAELPVPANERFVDFDNVSYTRSARRKELLFVLQQDEEGGWVEQDDVSLLLWLEFANGPAGRKLGGIDGFVAAASDALRGIEFFHNYAVPVDLWAAYVE
jgi:hypothetical protein